MQKQSSSQMLLLSCIGAALTVVILVKLWLGREIRSQGDILPSKVSFPTDITTMVICHVQDPRDLKKMVLVSRECRALVEFERNRRVEKAHRCARGLFYKLEYDSCMSWTGVFYSLYRKSRIDVMARVENSIHSDKFGCVILSVLVTTAGTDGFKCYTNIIRDNVVTEFSIDRSCDARCKRGYICEQGQYTRTSFGNATAVYTRADTDVGFMFKRIEDFCNFRLAWATPL
jgi:hypothetical protein